MRIFAELLWLWKGLGISLLPSAVGVGPEKPRDKRIALGAESESKKYTSHSTL